MAINWISIQFFLSEVLCECCRCWVTQRPYTTTKWLSLLNLTEVFWMGIVSDWNIHIKWFQGYFAESHHLAYWKLYTFSDSTIIRHLLIIHCIVGIKGWICLFWSFIKCTNSYLAPVLQYYSAFHFSYHLFINGSHRCKQYTFQNVRIDMVRVCYIHRFQQSASKAFDK